MKLTTAGESHGKRLVAIIEGLPSGIFVDEKEINYYLSLRQSGYGRGERQKIENDRVEIFCGVRDKFTLGSPVCLSVENIDYRNREDSAALRPLTRVRPGHADLPGAVKYALSDARNVSERASARETAVRVAADSLLRGFLKQLGIEISGYVKSVCGVKDENTYTFGNILKAKELPLFMLDEKARLSAMRIIDSLKAEGDTAGGVCEIRVKGLKSGFGSCMTYDGKLDGKLAGALMGVQSVKGVEFGMGFACADERGSCVHDEIFNENGKFVRRSNNAGGIEGGMSNGEEIVVRCAVKPIPTLKMGMRTVDIVTGEECLSVGERSDVCAICAAEIILEGVVAEVISSEILLRLGGDNTDDIIKRYGLLK